jgi:hypothetical protein
MYIMINVCLMASYQVQKLVNIEWYVTC